LAGIADRPLIIPRFADLMRAAAPERALLL
jgi:hypothetical protein